MNFMIAVAHGLSKGWDIKVVASLIGAILIVIIGNNPMAYQAILVLVIIDFITGVMCGIKCKTVSSRSFLSTAKKLSLFFLFMITAHQMSIISESWKELEVIVAMFLATNEALSIVENLHKLGIPLPKFIIDKLKIYQIHE